MITFIYDGGNAQKLIGKLKALDPGIEGAIHTGLTRIGLEMHDDAGTNAPFDTGNLRRSITAKVTKRQVKVGSNLVYARIHDKGGVTGRGYRVKIAAKRYLTGAFEKMQAGRAIEILQDELDRVFSK